MTFEDIKLTTKFKFSKILREAIRKSALDYLTKKQGSKGQEMVYTELKMADYLMPNNVKITIEQQRNIFAIRNRMVMIPSNFSSNQNKEYCPCGIIEDMKHVYDCEFWNHEQKCKETPFEVIFNDNIEDQIKVSKKLYKHLQKRDTYKNKENHESHAIPSGATVLLCENSNGNK